MERPSTSLSMGIAISLMSLFVPWLVIPIFGVSLVQVNPVSIMTINRLELVEVPAIVIAISLATCVWTSLTIAGWKIPATYPLQLVATAAMTIMMVSLFLEIDDPFLHCKPSWGFMTAWIGSLLMTHGNRLRVNHRAPALRAINVPCLNPTRQTAGHPEAGYRIRR